MITHLVPAREIQIGDTLRYLSVDPLVVREIVELKKGAQKWLLISHESGTLRVNNFAHLHRQVTQA